MRAYANPSALLLCLLAAITGVVPAFAQLKPQVLTGSHIPVSPEAIEAREAGLIKKAFGRCIYRHAPAAAMNVLMHSDSIATDFTGIKIDDLNTTFGMPECLGAQASDSQIAIGYKFKRADLHLLLAEEAYLAATPKLPVLPPNATEMLYRRFVASPEFLARAQAVAAFEDCIVFHDLTHADAMLRAAPASVAEHEAAAALAPTMGSCLATGEKVSLNIINIRGYVADGLWNRFVRPSLSAQALSGKP